MDPIIISTVMPRWLVLALLLVPAAFHPAQAQISQLKQAVESKQPEQAPAAEKPEDTRKRLEQWQKEAREMLGRLDGSTGAAVAPEGITPVELSEGRRDLE